MRSPEHPCGNLPTSGWSMSVWYCHHHQAFHAYVSMTHQSGEDDTRYLHSAAAEFGPFDGIADVRRWLQVYANDWELLPSMPAGEHLIGDRHHRDHPASRRLNRVAPGE